MAALLAGATVFSCSPRTTITGTWREPDAPPGPYRRVVAIVLAKDPNVRRIAEDEFVRRLPRDVEGFRSYAVVPKEDEGDVDKVVARLRAQDIDGAAVMRLVDQNSRVVYDPGSYWRPYYAFTTYYGAVWTSLNDPGYLIPEMAVHVETAFYSVNDEKLVWTGYSKTVNPDEVQDVIDDVSRVMVSRLRQEKLLP